MSNPFLGRFPKPWRFVFVAAFLIFGTAWATARIVADFTGGSSIQLSWDGVDYEGRKTTTDFNVYSIWDPSASDERMILLKTVASQAVNADETDGRVDLEARFGVNGRFDDVAWTLSEEADSVKVLTTQQGFVMTTINGTFGVRGQNRAYDPKTGRLVFPYASFGEATIDWAPPFEVLMRNATGSVGRFIGVLTPDSPRDFVSQTLADGRQKIATIVYSDGTRILQTAHLFGTLPRDPTGVEGPEFNAEIMALSGVQGAEKEGNTLFLQTPRGANQSSDVGASDVGGFGIKLSINTPDRDERQQIDCVIAFDADAFSPQRSVLPWGYQVLLARLPLPRVSRPSRASRSPRCARSRAP